MNGGGRRPIATNFVTQYWGKAPEGAHGEVTWHPLAYHSLDVAAVGQALFVARPALRSLLGRPTNLRHGRPHLRQENRSGADLGAQIDGGGCNGKVFRWRNRCRRCRGSWHCCIPPKSLEHPHHTDCRILTIIDLARVSIFRFNGPAAIGSR